MLKSGVNPRSWHDNGSSTQKGPDFRDCKTSIIAKVCMFPLLRLCFQVYTFPHPHTLLYQLVSKNWYLWTHLTFYCPGLISFTDWECFQPCNFLFLFSLTDQPGSGSDECQNVAAAEGGAAALPAPLNYLQLVVFPRKVQNLCFTGAR